MKYYNEKITKIEGVLEVDHLRGVIYFHSNVDGSTKLRICNLSPISDTFDLLDITHMVGSHITVRGA